MDTKLYSTSQIRQLEKEAIERFHLHENSLMERAGAAAFAQFRAQWPWAVSIMVICGPGNNGGDGYVFATKAKESGLLVEIQTVGDVAKLTSSAKKAYDKCRELGIVIRAFCQIDKGIEVLVDAIFGIGLSKPVTSEFGTAISAINKSGLPVLAIDIPSGLQADSGKVLGVAIKASSTITFIGYKKGCFTADGPDYCGELYLDDLSLSRALYQAVPCYLHLLAKSMLTKHLPKRSQNSHKGDYGHVVIVGGNKGMVGAVRLAAEAALRIGAGLVTVVTRPEYEALINVHYPEIMSQGINEPRDIKSLLAKATVLIIGPGLGQDQWAKELLDIVLASSMPLVIDADGLNLLGEHPACRDNWILTPHPGEAGRLLGMATTHIQADRFSALTQLTSLGGHWILKGMGTLVGTGEQTYLCPFGNPGMASGGMGDALSGILGGLIAQNIAIDHAVYLGVLIHALAGDAAANNGQRGMLASDLIAHIRTIVNLKPS